MPPILQHILKYSLDFKRVVKCFLFHHPIYVEGFLRKLIFTCQVQTELLCNYDMASFRWKTVENVVVVSNRNFHRGRMDKRTLKILQYLWSTHALSVLISIQVFFFFFLMTTFQLPNGCFSK